MGSDSLKQLIYTFHKPARQDETYFRMQNMNDERRLRGKTPGEPSKTSRLPDIIGHKLLSGTLRITAKSLVSVRTTGKPRASSKDIENEVVLHLVLAL